MVEKHLKYLLLGQKVNVTAIPYHWCLLMILCWWNLLTKKPAENRNLLIESAGSEETLRTSWINTSAKNFALHQPNRGLRTLFNCPNLTPWFVLGPDLPLRTASVYQAGLARMSIKNTFVGAMGASSWAKLGVLETSNVALYTVYWILRDYSTG